MRGLRRSPQRRLAGQAVAAAAESATCHVSRLIQLTFLGGAGTVTGSRTLVSTEGRDFLVD